MDVAIPIDSISNVVNDALDALIEHYQQPIHVHDNVLDDLVVKDVAVDDEELEANSNASLPPFVAALLRRIHSSSNSSRSSTTVATREDDDDDPLPPRSAAPNSLSTSTTVDIVEQLLLCGYHDKIRPLIKASLDTDMDMDNHQNTLNSTTTNISIKIQRLRSLVVVLKHYEKLVVQSSQNLTVGAIMSDLDTDKSSSIATIATTTSTTTDDDDDDTSNRRLNAVLLMNALLQDIAGLQQQLEQQRRLQSQVHNNDNDTKNDNDTQSIPCSGDDATLLHSCQAQTILWRLVHATLTVHLEQVVSTRGHETMTPVISALDEADQQATRHCICVLLGTDPFVTKWTYFDLDSSLQLRFLDAATQYHAIAIEQPNVGNDGAAQLPQKLTLESTNMPASYHRDAGRLLFEHVGLLATTHQATIARRTSVVEFERRLSTVHARIWTLLDTVFSSLREPGQSSEKSRHSVDCPTKQRVLDALDWNECAVSIKSHFFGTDSTNSNGVASRNNSLAPKQRLHLGHVVPDDTTRAIPSSSTKAYHVEKSRFWAALHFGALPGEAAATTE